MWESIEIDNVNYNDENYVGISDLNWVKCPSASLPAQFAATVYDEHPRVFGHMARVFVPGYRERDTHYAVRDTLQEKDPEIVVVVLNGENKRVYYYENPEDCEYEPKSVELIPEGMEEVCDTIARIITNLNLLERPIVWTGNICVSMGQTLAHETVGAFTSVLINTHAMDASALYQLLGRATGRYLGWGIDMYPTVYSPIEVKNVCEELESAAKKLANDFSGKEVTQGMYSSMCPTAYPQKKKADSDDETVYSIDHKFFDTMEEYGVFIKKDENTDWMKSFGRKRWPTTKEINKHEETDGVINYLENPKSKKGCGGPQGGRGLKVHWGLKDGKKKIIMSYIVKK